MDTKNVRGFVFGAKDEHYTWTEDSGVGIGY